MMDKVSAVTVGKSNPCGGIHRLAV